MKDQTVITYSGIPQNHSILSIIKPVVCSSKEHANAYFNQLCKDRPKEQRAEGIILRDPTAWYYKRNSFFKKEVNIQLVLSNVISFLKKQL